MDMLQGLTSGALPVGAGAYTAASAASCSGPQPDDSGSPQAASPEALALHMLGWSANAAGSGKATRSAALPGVGPLLPAWRELAHILAPLFHTVCNQ
jgi:hypothetical protein